MGEEFQGGVCRGTWWNPPHGLFSGGLSSSPCSVTQLGGGGSFDMGGFGWPNNEAAIKGGIKCNYINNYNNNNNNNNNQGFDNLVVFPDQIMMDSTSLDILGFGLSPTSSTTDWNPQTVMCNNGSNNEGSFDSFLQGNINMSNSSRLFGSYGMEESSPNMMMNSTSNFSCNNNTISQDASPPMATMTASSNSSGDSSTITCDGGSGGGGLATSFPMNSSASYLIQSLFDDSEDQSHHHFINNPSSYGTMDATTTTSEIISSNSWINSSVDHNHNHNQNPPQLQALQGITNLEGVGMNAMMMMNNNNGNGTNNQGQLSGQYSPTTLSNIRVSLLNSLQSRSRGPNSYNQKSLSCATTTTTTTTTPSSKVNTEDIQIRRESKNNTSSSDQPPAKRARIETPSPLPTFKVRKEKLGDRITALQQLVSPFGKTDTASVLNEAIEYIRFLHDQVHVLSTPYLKKGGAMQQQGGSEKSKDNEEPKQELISRGLCLVPISSTYPVAQETPVDFWTPTFGGNAFR